jgi:2-dehydro-3-deoxyphosphooctonate aldolase (KDO 8-P synthase)
MARSVGGGSRYVKCPNGKADPAQTGFRHSWPTAFSAGIYFPGPGWYNAGVLNEAALWKSLKTCKRLALIAGPCVIESEKLCLRVAATLQRACERLGILYVFKASYDKANRTSAQSFRGPGLDAGLQALARVKAELGVPVLTDVHTEAQARAAAEVVDILQIPAFLCRQTDLIAAAVATGKVVNLKKGQFLSPQEMGQVVGKARSMGGEKLLVTERGTTFGYNNLVADMRSIPILRRLGAPVIFDATHSVQLPGGGGDKSSGQRQFAPVLARCAVAAGADGLFVETHPDPDRALSDGPNMVPLRDMAALLDGLLKVRAAVKGA